MNKTSRLQLRMDPDLKDWFDKYADPLGGMSKIVHAHVEGLYEQQNGKPWKEGDKNGSADPQEDGPCDRREGDPSSDQAGPT